jgi:hypothetical protein
MKRLGIGNYALLKTVLLALFISFGIGVSSASNATLSDFYQSHDPYTKHLRIMSKFYRIFNPDMSVRDVERLCWASWKGCGEDSQAALWLSMVQALERNFKPETDLGCKVQGYSGQYWHVLIKAAKHHGMTRPKCGWRIYFRDRPYEAEYHIARWFKETFYDNRGAWETIAIWHRGSNWRNNPSWVRDVNVYRRNIMVVYRKYYVPVAETLYPEPPKLDLAQDSIGSPMKMKLVQLTGSLDLGKKID